MSLAGADSGLWAVDGGNKRVCSGLLYNSKSDLISARVTSVSIKLRPSKTGSRFLPVFADVCVKISDDLFHDNFFPFRPHDQFLRGELRWGLRAGTRAVRHCGHSGAASPGQV